MGEYSVTSADPSGYYLAPDGVLDPTQWAWMQHASPVEEIAALRAKVERMERVVELSRRVTRSGYCLPGWCGTDEGKECTCGMGELRQALAALDAGGGE